jgi:penicillin G amidase
MAHQASTKMTALYEVNRAGSIQQALKAMEKWDCPAQNFVMASRKNNIAMLVAGKFPLKWKEQGKYLMDGSNPAYEWQGYIPQVQNAMIINPPRGFVSSANQRPFDDTYPYYYYNDTEEHFRNRRVNNLLGSMTNITPADMMKMQNDNYSVLASEILPVMLDTVMINDNDTTRKAMFDALTSWNYNYTPESVAPSYFHTWFYYLEKLTWDEFENKVPLPDPDPYQLSWMLRKYPHDSIFDIKITSKYETYVDIIRQSFADAADSIVRWREANRERPIWYLFKNTQVDHLVPNFKTFSEFNIPAGGYAHIINASTRTHGPSWRQVVEMGDTINAWAIYPGGQSGNPGSPYYKTFLNDWAHGNYFKVKYLKDVNEAEETPGGKLVRLSADEDGNK